MSGLDGKARGRVLMAGKIIFNFGQSTIDCLVRRISENGATIDVASGLGIPDRFQLSVVSEDALLPCKLAWHSEKQIGVTFDLVANETPVYNTESSTNRMDQVLRSQMLAL